MKFIKKRKNIIILFIIILLVILLFCYLKTEDNSEENQILKSAKIYINYIENNLFSNNKNISGYYDITKNGIKKENDKEITIKLRGIKPISGKIKIGDNGKVLSSNFILGNYFINTNEENIQIRLISDNIYNNKIMSVLGDSISTYKGYVPTINDYAYPRTYLLTDVNLTWWYRLINDFNMKLGINESWAGSRVFNSDEKNYSSFGPDRHMASMTRLNNLDNNGTPDVIFFYGGTNDIGHSSNLEIFDSNEYYVKDIVDLKKTTYSSFTEAYTLAIRRIKYLYPNSELIVLLPMSTKTYYTEEELNNYTKIIKEICKRYNIFYIDLSLCGINQSSISTYLSDGVHPNSKGMYLISEYVQSEIKRNFYRNKEFNKYMTKAK